MKKSIAVAAALSGALALGACSTSPRPQPAGMPQSTPSKRIAIIGSEVVLPDGTRAPMDATGGFLLPNGERVLRDARGALVLPNGNRCLPDGQGYACP
ncbi:hypothetical protein ABIE41_001430 [Bosea sp. OAE506]|uniref:hypothetical protein n=1 Tax=Bosea sp. OAE506 TaxID=2663870 RepID=UPI0017896542